MSIIGALHLIAADNSISYFIFLVTPHIHINTLFSTKLTLNVSNLSNTLIGHEARLLYHRFIKFYFQPKGKANLGPINSH